MDTQGLTTRGRATGGFRETPAQSGGGGGREEVGEPNLLKLHIPVLPHGGTFLEIQIALPTLKKSDSLGLKWVPRLWNFFF